MAQDLILFKKMVSSEINYSADKLSIGGETFLSRLFLGTGKFSSGEVLKEVVTSSATQMVTLSMKRADPQRGQDSILKYLDQDTVRLLPNTSGARNANEAVFVARMAREALDTSWLKLEIHPDPKYLMPDPLETLRATETLVKEGFKVLPYCHADPVLCKQLEEAGAVAVMPLGSPIGSNKGLASRVFLKIIIEQANIPVVIDAGIGKPSHAAEAFELGADAVLINTAIAVSQNPPAMANAFRKASEAGRSAYNAGLAKESNYANASSPLTAFLK